MKQMIRIIAAIVVIAVAWVNCSFAGCEGGDAVNYALSKGEKGADLIDDELANMIQANSGQIDSILSSSKPRMEALIGVSDEFFASAKAVSNALVNDIAYYYHDELIDVAKNIDDYQYAMDPINKAINSISVATRKEVSGIGDFLGKYGVNVREGFNGPIRRMTADDMIRVMNDAMNRDFYQHLPIPTRTDIIAEISERIYNGSMPSFLERAQYSFLTSSKDFKAPRGLDIYNNLVKNRRIAGVLEGVFDPKKPFTEHLSNHFLRKLDGNPGISVNPIGKTQLEKVKIQGEATQGLWKNKVDQVADPDKIRRLLQDGIAENRGVWSITGDVVGTGTKDGGYSYTIRGALDNKGTSESLVIHFNADYEPVMIKSIPDDKVFSYFEITGNNAVKNDGLAQLPLIGTPNSTGGTDLPVPMSNVYEAGAKFQPGTDPTWLKNSQLSGEFNTIINSPSNTQFNPTSPLLNTNADLLNTNFYYNANQSVNLGTMSTIMQSDKVGTSSAQLRSKLRTAGFNGLMPKQLAIQDEVWEYPVSLFLNTEYDYQIYVNRLYENTILLDNHDDLQVSGYLCYGGLPLSNKIFTMYYGPYGEKNITTILESDGWFSFWAEEDQSNYNTTASLAIDDKTLFVLPLSWQDITTLVDNKIDFYPYSDKQLAYFTTGQAYSDNIVFTKNGQFLSNTKVIAEYQIEGNDNWQLLSENSNNWLTDASGAINFSFNWNQPDIINFRFTIADQEFYLTRIWEGSGTTPPVAVIDFIPQTGKDIVYFNTGITYTEVVTFTKNGQALANVPAKVEYQIQGTSEWELLSNNWFTTSDGKIDFVAMWYDPVTVQFRLTCEGKEFFLTRIWRIGETTPPVAVIDFIPQTGKDIVYFNTGITYTEVVTFTKNGQALANVPAKVEYQIQGTSEWELLSNNWFTTSDGKIDFVAMWYDPVTVQFRLTCEGKEFFLTRIWRIGETTPPVAVIDFIPQTGKDTVYFNTGVTYTEVVTFTKNGQALANVPAKVEYQIQGTSEWELLSNNWFTTTDGKIDFVAMWYDPVTVQFRLTCEGKEFFLTRIWRIGETTPSTGQANVLPDTVTVTRAGEMWNFTSVDSFGNPITSGIGVQQGANTYGGNWASTNGTYSCDLTGEVKILWNGNVIDMVTVNVMPSSNVGIVHVLPDTVTVKTSGQIWTFSAIDSSGSPITSGIGVQQGTNTYGGNWASANGTYSCDLTGEVKILWNGNVIDVVIVTVNP